MKKILLSGQKGADMRAYLRALSPFGRVLPAGESADGDLLVLAGGGDISPRFARYAGDLSKICIEDEARDRMELARAARFLAKGKPILGICRGAQLLHTALGGTLFADLGTDAHQNSLHMIRILPGSRISAILGKSAAVNSFHHQAAACPGQNLRITARALDGVCEAAEHDFLPVLGVQWHPERMAEEKMHALITSLIG